MAEKFENKTKDFRKVELFRGRLGFRNSEHKQILKYGLRGILKHH